MGRLLVHFSNQTESLTAELARLISSEPAPLFGSDWVVIQSRGLERYLQMELARHNGFSAACHFPYPGTLITQLLHSGALEKLSFPFDLEKLRFIILEILPDLVERSEFHTIQNYLEQESENSDSRLLALADKLAGLYERYVLYDFEMIRAWSDGSDLNCEEQSLWQAHLWREIIRRYPDQNPVTEWDNLIATIHNAPEKLDFLAGRIFMFGVTTLPPLYRDIFFELTSAIDIHLFFPLSAKLSDGGELSPHRNQLLEACARTEYEFLEYLFQLHADYPERIAFHDYSEPFPTTTLLQRIQNSVYRNQSRPELLSAMSSEKQPDQNDRSLQIHSCHSPLREVEVLYDQLLSYFQNDPELRPSEIAVMTRDISRYAPLIHSVFGNPEENTPGIPYHIADQLGNRTQSVIQLLSSFLNLFKGRFSVVELYELLEFPEVGRHFDLSRAELELIHGWLYDSNIHWGLNRSHLDRLGFSSCFENSWESGQKRLLLGTMVSAGELFFSINPTIEIENEQLPTLEKLLNFMSRVEEFQPLATSTKSPTEWAATIVEIMSALTGETTINFAPLQQLINRLRESADYLKQEQHYSLELVTTLLDELITSKSGGQGFLRGGVVFCNLLPMRTVPFRVIALLGMNEENFPASDRELSFNLLRSRTDYALFSDKNLDRQLFIQTILAARDHLYISYIGKNIHTNQLIHPTMLVTELISYTGLLEWGGLPAQKRRSAAENRVTTFHRLQGFNPDYFNRESGDKDKNSDTLSSNLFSYSKLRERSAASHSQTPSPATPFFCSEEKVASISSVGALTITLNEITNFLRNPTLHFLRNRLGIRLSNQSDELSPDEIVIPDSLKSFQLRDTIMREHHQKENAANTFAMLRGAGALPPGQVGGYYFWQYSFETGQLLERVNQLTAEESFSSTSFELHLQADRQDIIFSGNLTQLTSRGRITFRSGKLRAVDLLESWIAHLTLCAALPEKIKPESYCLAQDLRKQGEVNGYRLKTVTPEESRLQLIELITLYQECETEPLPFFPESALSYQEKLNAKNDPELAFQAAQLSWQSAYMKHGENEHPAYGIVYRDSDPLSDPTGATAVKFTQLASRIYTPILKILDSLPEGGDE